MAVFVAGLAPTVAGFRIGGDGLACEVSGERICSGGGVGEELVYAGLALVAVAILTTVVTAARRA
jgi:hypothetical protein